MKKKVIVYVENYSFGGLEKFVCDFIQNNPYVDILLLANKDNNRLKLFAKNNNIPFEFVNIYSLHLSSKFTGILKKILQGVDVALRYTYFFKNIYYLKNMLSKFNGYTHILIVNGGYPGALSCLSAVIAAKKVGFENIGLSILSCPASDYYQFPLHIIQNSIDSYISQNVTYFHVNSQAIKNDLIQITRLNAEKIHVVYTGVAIPENITKTRILDLQGCEITKKADDIWFGMVSVLGSTKTQNILLEAISLLVDEFPNLHCLIVGDGPEHLNLVALASNLKISQNVIFCGQSSEHDQIYRFLDACVFSSFHEGLPYAVSEAMSYSLPIIASDVGGVPEQISDGIDGYLVPKNDAISLASRMKLLLAKRDIWLELGEKARIKAIKSFSIEAMKESLNLLLSLK
ncbi:MAG: glycosyltransferase family 4 protein [Sulfuricurvum sp.]